MTVQGIKSDLELPWPARLPEGRHAVYGRAWSGEAKILRVEYSLDGGGWSPAKLEGPNVPRAWARFVFGWNAKTGEHGIRVRATDAAGNTQSNAVARNQFGYDYNAVVTHPVKVL